MYITDKASVHVAKFAPQVINWSYANNSNWQSGSYAVDFRMTFSAGGAASVTHHVARMITQADWGFPSWRVKQVKVSYQPDSNMGTVNRYYGYYGSHYAQVEHINERGNVSGTYSNSPSRSNWISTNTNLGPGGAFKIHSSANGGYYRDAWATDYYVQVGNYSTVMFEISVETQGGAIWDNEYTAQQIYPAAFGSSASQSDADSWQGAPSGGGRGIWFNATAGLLHHHGSGSSFGSITGY